MPFPTQTKILGIKDAKLSKLTNDDSTTLGYATSIDAPGIQTIKVTPKYVTKELKGDEQILDEYSRVESVEWSFDNSIVSLDVLALLMGGTSATSGVTPSQKSNFSVGANNTAPYFKLMGQSVYTDVVAGSVNVTFWKCKAQKCDYELKGEDYAIVSASGIAIPTVKDGKIHDIDINETAVALS